MRISTPEFISLMAMLVATVAISIDALCFRGSNPRATTKI